MTIRVIPALIHLLTILLVSASAKANCVSCPQGFTDECLKSVLERVSTSDDLCLKYTEAQCKATETFSGTLAGSGFSAKADAACGPSQKATIRFARSELGEAPADEDLQLHLVNIPTGWSEVKRTVRSPAFKESSCYNCGQLDAGCIESVLKKSHDSSEETCLYLDVDNCGHTWTTKTEPASLKTTAECLGKKVKVAFQRDTLASITPGTTVAVELHQDGQRKYGNSATMPAPDTKPAEKKNDDRPGTRVPIDVQPERVDAIPTAEQPCPEGAKCLIVREDLSLDPRSPKVITETDVVIVRFLVRKGLSCRMMAVSDNEYKPTPFRVGGADGLGGFDLSTFVSAEDKFSCGYPLETQGDGQYTFKEDEASQSVFVDWRLGPFTDNQVKIQLYRRDRNFSGYDLASEITIANHKRYSGWFDVAFLGTAWFDGRASYGATPVSGSELRRITEDRNHFDVDVAALVKWFAWCSGKDNGWFKPADLQEANACLGLSSGLSLNRPLDTFFPLGVHFTAGFISVHGMYALGRTETLAGSLAVNDLYSREGSVPTNTRIAHGLTVGIGLDPTIASTLIKALVMGK
jgi:hypothetical protein